MDGSAFSPGIAASVHCPEPVRESYPGRLADVLRPACRALPLAGCAAALDELVRWVESGAERVCTVTGPSGAGKSRLVAEAAALTSRPFLAVDADVPWDAAGAPLVVMTRRSELVPAAATAVIVEPPGPVQRRVLFEAAYAAGAARAGRPGQRIGVPRLPDEAAACLIMAGLIAPEIGATAALAMTPEKRADWIAARENSALEAAARQAGFDPWPVRHMAACIIHRGGASVEEAIGMVQAEAEAGMLHLHCSAEELVDFLADLMLEHERLAPVADGAVGRAFMRQAMSCHDDATRDAILRRVAVGRSARLPVALSGSTLLAVTATDQQGSCHFALESPA